MPFECNYCFCCSQFRLKGTTTRKHNLNLKCTKVWNNFASKVTEGNTCLAKKSTEVQYIKRAFKLIFVCMCMLLCMCMCNVYDQYCTCMAQVSGLSCGCCPCPRLGSPPASNYLLPPFLAWHHVESSSGVCQPQLQPQPLSSAASTSCLQEGPTLTPFFHFLCCSWCGRVADYSRPVAMTDCCCCPSPFWPHKIVHQSTGLLKPLIECRV